VVLTTIHVAKGLEFVRVIVVGCSEGLLPHERSLKHDAGLEEERRLMYVAMTRAKNLLALSFYDIPSRFLAEIPVELTAFEGLTSSHTPFEEDEEKYITLD
jgi:DNA helicase-2/ATP-dependent DNA helicase PcrA